MPLPEPDSSLLEEPVSKKKKKPKQKGQGKKEPDGHDLAVQQRKLAALNLRKAGWDFNHIAQTLGIDYHEAVSLVKTELNYIIDACQDSAAELMVLELERLDELYRFLHIKAERGDVRAIETMLKISERRAKLLGMDAPETKELTVRLANLTDDELRSEYERLGFTAHVQLGNVIDVLPTDAQPITYEPLPGEEEPPNNSDAAALR